jgi:hypothetical protein
MLTQDCQEGSELDAKSPLRGSVLPANLHFAVLSRRRLTMRVMVQAALLVRLDRPPRDLGVAFLQDLRERAIAIYRGAPKHGRPPDARALARCVFDLRPDDTKAVRLERRRELGRGHLKVDSRHYPVRFSSETLQRSSVVQASFFCSRPSAARNSRSAKFPATLAAWRFPKSPFSSRAGNGPPLR